MKSKGYAEKRVQAEFEGVVRFNIRARRWEVDLIVYEHGHKGGRESHGRQCLTDFEPSTMSGRFSSTAADSEGVVYWSKDKLPLPVFSGNG
jgi:hypothetical protein